MLWWLLPLIILAASLIVLIVIAVRKIPQLRVINVEETLEEKIKKTKENLILERFKRLQKSKFGRVTGGVGSLFNQTRRLGRKTVHRLKDLEHYYQELKETSEGAHATDPEKIKRMMDEALELMKADKLQAAEKKYVEVISHNPKFVDAYEDLGRLYIKMKKPEQAKETLNFILSLNPEDASVLTSLGEIALVEEDPVLALEYFEKAVQKRPGNPKYLDFLIEASLQAEEVEPARRGIDQLKKVNPENKKIDEFESRFGKLSVTPGSSEE
ncbi:MAG: tetratricopeptide repeat protein [Candidatus Uhrbacteria bacterium]|nr:tetratricopeptide repeat protein [Patescibacteria group bacterium]MBU1906992.1 tetratricopeptide repeat protein [Patescibacteria group bacterium]